MPAWFKPPGGSPGQAAATVRSRRVRSPLPASRPETEMSSSSASQWMPSTVSSYRSRESRGAWESRRTRREAQHPLAGKRYPHGVAVEGHAFSRNGHSKPFGSGPHCEPKPVCRPGLGAGVYLPVFPPGCNGRAGPRIGVRGDNAGLPSGEVEEPPRGPGSTARRVSCILRSFRRDQARSKRSRFMTLSHAAAKSRANFCPASSLP